MLQVILRQHSNIPFSLSNNKENIPALAHQSTASDCSINPEDSKQKSELCRRFMDYGFCPYEGRCKFAHGSHELLKNNQVNNKYKTKYCQNFKKNHCCMYGKRCNFIHQLPDREPTVLCHGDVEFQLVRKQRQRGSRLLCLLGM